MDRSGLWFQVDNGWIEDCNGDPVVKSAGCGTNAAEWDELALPKVLAVPDMIYALEMVREYLEYPEGQSPSRLRYSNIVSLVETALSKSNNWKLNNGI